MSPCGEFGFPLAGFEKARQAWAGCGRAARSAILLYAQARKARRRPEIAAVSFEPNSSTRPGMNYQTWVAGIVRVRRILTKEAMFWKTERDRSVRCGLCHHRCLIGDGKQ